MFSYVPLCCINVSCWKKVDWKNNFNSVNYTGDYTVRHECNHIIVVQRDIITYEAFYFFIVHWGSHGPRVRQTRLPRHFMYTHTRPHLLVRSCGAARFNDYVIDFTDKTTSAGHNENPPQKRTHPTHASSPHGYFRNGPPYLVRSTLTLVLVASG